MDIKRASETIRENTNISTKELSETETAEPMVQWRMFKTNCSKEILQIAMITASNTNKWR
jgi:hypothetical protein